MKCSRDMWTAALKLLRHATLTGAHAEAFAPLAEVVVSAADGRAVIHGHDTQTEMRVRFPAQGSLDKVSAPLDALSKLTNAGKRTKGEEMSVERTDRGMRLVIGGRTFDVAQGYDDRPPDLSRREWAEADLAHYGAPAFRQALDYCVPAMSTDPTRFHMHCVRFEDDRVITVDGHRMHVARDIETFESGPVSIAPGTAQALRAALKLADPAWVMARTIPGYIQFDVGGVFVDALITGKLVEGQFPPWEQVVPQHKKSFALEAAAFVESIRTAQKLAGLSSTLLAVHRECRIEIENLFSEVIPVAWKPASKFQVWFNAKYMLDAASGADELVRVEHGDEMEALLVRPNDDLLGVVMPCGGSGPK